MDNLDKISIVITAVLIALLAMIGMDYQGDAGGRQMMALYGTADASGTVRAPDERMNMLKALITGDNMNKAEALLGEMLTKYPYDGAPRMLMGDIMMRRQDPVAAMTAYKEAVDLNPDYVDRKTAAFQGRKIKNTLDEAKGIIMRALSENPDDKEMKDAKNNMYYLMRKLAGSCG